MTEIKPAHLSDFLLNEYLDDALTPSDRISAETHLKGCTACAARVGAMRNLFVELNSLPEIAPVVDFSARILPLLEKNPVISPVLRWLTAFQLAGAAIGLILLWPLLEAFGSSLFITGQESISFFSTLSFSWTLPVVTWELPRLGLDFSTSALVFVVVSATLMWILGNSFLLARPLRRIG